MLSNFKSNTRPQSSRECNLTEQLLDMFITITGSFA